MPRRSRGDRSRPSQRRRPPRPGGSVARGGPAGPRPALPGAGLPGGVVLLLIGLGVVLLHWGGLRLPFFADDYLFLEQVRGRTLFGALAAPDPIGNFFRPVGRQIYFWLVGRLSGESPAVFHAVNLAVFLGIVALLFVIGRRLAGPQAAAVAAAVLGLHYAADVPLRWVSGSQDLLAVLGALGAISLYLGGRRGWAALSLLLGLLAKETVLLTPVIAAVAGRRPRESWRVAVIRAWPLGLAVVAWAGLWIATAPQRRGLEASLGWEPLGAIAVLAHLVHVALGLEWRGALEAPSRAVPPWPALLAMVAAAAGARSVAARSPRAVFATALAWTLAAAVPLIAVASVWSAYYYLFALCGVALAVGAFAARGGRWGAVAAVVLLAAGSQYGRSSPEFATARGAWRWQSHINRRYVDRATERLARYLDDLKRERPTVPPRSTFFFGSIPAFVGLQTADGPVVRWAYRDTSLRSYFQSDFTLERGRRGPVFFFRVVEDRLTPEVREPGEVRGIAVRVLLSDRVEQARDLLRWLTEQESPSADVLYFLAWTEWALGDTARAAQLLEQAGLRADRGPSPVRARAAALVAAGDTVAAGTLVAGAIQGTSLDAQLHGMLAEMRLRHDPEDVQARIEAFAARALIPDDATGWVRWGAIQAHDGRHQNAIRSFERALELGIPDPTRANQVRAAIVELRRVIPGGELAQQAMRRGTGGPGGGGP